jgi:hypothetical protein
MSTTIQLRTVAVTGTATFCKIPIVLSVAPNRVVADNPYLSLPITHKYNEIANLIFLERYYAIV